MVTGLAGGVTDLAGVVLDSGVGLAGALASEGACVESVAGFTGVAPSSVVSS